jgi:glycosylphosphatidylinositol transamidase (GPIT) subunit GPI8
MVEKEIPLIKAEKTSNKNILLDPKGFFVIELDKKSQEIRVEYYTNVYKNKRIVSGILQKIFIGKKADALCDTIVKNVPQLLPIHYMYLGRELKTAQYSLENNEKYIQGGC